MTKNLNYMDILLQIKKGIASKNEDFSLSILSYKNFEDFLTEQLSKLNIRNDVCFNNEHVTYAEEIKNFLLALIASINIAEANNKTSITISNEGLKDKYSSFHKIAFISSEFGELFLKSQNKLDDERNGDELDDDELDFDKKYLHTNKARNLPINCAEILSPLCNAILCNMKRYPYIVPSCYYYETDIYQRLRHPKTTKKRCPKENFFSEYPTIIKEDTTKEYYYTTMRYVYEEERHVGILMPEILDALLTIGGIDSVEEIEFIFDPTYHNPNLANPDISRRFYSSTYKQFFKNICDNDDEQIKLFHYFTIENILQGTTLFSFCKTFCGNKFDNFYSNIGNFDIQKKIDIQRNDDSKIIHDIFRNINEIDNPFLKKSIIEKILADSYYHDYCYNGDTHTAGKEDINAWCEFIKTYCSVFCQIEKKVYPILLVYLHNHSNNNFDESLKAYETFFSGYMYDIKTQKTITPSRGARFPKLLKIALISSFNGMNPRVLHNLIPNKD